MSVQDSWEQIQAVKMVQLVLIQKVPTGITITHICENPKPSTPIVSVICLRLLITIPYNLVLVCLLINWQKRIALVMLQ